MFEYHFLIPSENGDPREKVIADDSKNYIESIRREYARRGYKMLPAAICQKCPKLGQTCDGLNDYQAQCLKRRRRETA